MGDVGLNLFLTVVTHREVYDWYRQFMVRTPGAPRGGKSARGKQWRELKFQFWEDIAWLVSWWGPVLLSGRSNRRRHHIAERSAPYPNHLRLNQMRGQSSKILSERKNLTLRLKLGQILRERSRTLKTYLGNFQTSVR